MSESAPVICTRRAVASGEQEESAQAFGALDRECIAFSRYLLRREPSRYVLMKYREAHATGGFAGGPAAGRFDRLLL
ncbi:MAG: hypothetical protein ACRD68_04425, partial [Pyrinomonadaceae bacterium]